MSWPSVERLFAAAIEAPQEKRQALLDSEPDDAVRAEVSRLVARHVALSSAQHSFLHTLDLEHAAALVDRAEPEDPRAVGRYQIVRRLGVGATGVVYLARDPSLARQVALKLLSPLLSQEATGIRRFTDEARAASRLDHPHIVAVHEIGRSEDDRLFIAMAYYEGETLRERLARCALPLDEAVRIAGDVADGLSAAHAEGIVHRDIKPENILLTSRGARIVDFGIAKVAGETLTRTGAALGTAAYMSPEQTRGSGVDHRSDLWSLGVVLYEMLTGQRPFRADGSEALIYGIRHDAAEPVTARRPGLPPALARIVETCLQKEPDRRYQSAAALLSALRAPAPAGAGAGSAKRWSRVGLAVGGTALAAAAAILAAPGRDATGAPPEAAAVVRSVGVLPFVNMSPDPENTYFSDGLTEQIIAALSRMEGLQIAARTSSFALRDSRLDARAVGDTLGVEVVLEGSVRKDRDRLRVSAQLIDASTGYRIWSDEYNREMVDIFAVQDEIARAIAGALDLRLPRPGAVPRARRMPDLQAYDFYLRGLFLRNRLTVDALQRANDFFDRAIELEPGFALAYAAKASVVGARIYFRHVPRDPGVSAMRAAAARALELDPGLGEAHVALGMLRLFFDWDWAGAEKAMRRAIELNPSDPHAHHMLANYLRAMGRPEHALQARLRAAELDPLNARTGILLGGDYDAAGDLQQAIAEYRRAVRLDPMNPLALGLGPGLPAGPATVYLEQGRYQEAADDYLRIATLRGAAGTELDSVRSALARSDVQAFWRSWLAMDLRQSGSNPDPLRIAAQWTLIGDTTQALDWLDRAYAERNPGLVFLRFQPAFESIRSNPRVARILTEMRLPTR